MKLYMLSDRVRQIADSLIDADELTPEQSAFLDDIASEIESKVRNIVAIRREWLSEAEAMRAEAKRLTEMARVRESRADWLQDYCIRCLDAAGISKVKTDIGNVSVALASRPSIKWDRDIEQCPFVRTKIELDGTRAYEALKAGKLPDGFTVERSKHLRVS